VSLLKIQHPGHVPSSALSVNQIGMKTFPVEGQMPRQQEAVHGGIRRLSIYAGNTIPDEIINQLGMRYAVDSPTIVRMTLAQSAAKPKRREKAKKGQRYTRRLLIAALVRELASHDALRVEAARFYLRHIEFFSDENKDTRRLKLGLNVDAETYALCQSLPYSIVGKASVSLMYRVIVYFFAVKEKIMPAPPVSNIVRRDQLPDSSIPPYDPRLPLPERLNGKSTGPSTTLSFDPDGAKELKHLCALFKRKHAGLIRAAVRSVASNDQQLEGVKRFYRQEWVKKAPAKGRVQIRLNLAKEDTSLLDHLSYSVMGEFNRSLTARCIVGYFNKSGDKKLHEA
jgi:hypothetical protein